MMDAIAKTFSTNIERVPTDDYDEVEARLGKILKSQTAAPDFRPERADTAAKP